MQRILFIGFLIWAVALTLSPANAQRQRGNDRGGGGYGYGMGPGMMWGYGGGYGMGPGMMGGWAYVPSKLPAPKNAEWVQKLKDILGAEKESLAQYQADQEKYNAYMPYMMVIPQEENHIYWIEQLFSAYGLTADVKQPPVVSDKSLTEAYDIAVKLESDLLPKYEWLVKNAEDRDTAQALNVILYQSRIHLVMFDHARRIGTGYGYGMGSGRGGRGYGYGMGQGYGMGPGMMWGYGGGGYGYGPRQYRPGGKTIDMKEAKAMMNDYLRTTGNPNLKLGKIKDAGKTFEAEVLTKNNSLVDKILIDKDTGWMRSAY